MVLGPTGGRVGGGGCLKMAVGVEWVCKGCLHALAREKWGIWGDGGVNDR